MVIWKTAKVTRILSFSQYACDYPLIHIEDVITCGMNAGTHEHVFGSTFLDGMLAAGGAVKLVEKCNLTLFVIRQSSLFTTDSFINTVI